MYDEEIRIFVQSVSITGLNNNPNLFSSWNLNFNIKNLYGIFFLKKRNLFFYSSSVQKMVIRWIPLDRGPILQWAGPAHALSRALLK